MKNAENVAGALLKREAVKISMDPPFTWTSGIKSPVYCDNRKMIAFPEEREMIVDSFVEMINEQGMNPDVIAGTATAAIPWAAFVAQKMNKPMVYIRPKPKEHGVKKQIEGYLAPDQKVLIIEDLISTGGSSIKSADAVKNEGQCEVLGVMAIVTYELAKAVDNFGGADLSLWTLTNFKMIADLAVEGGSITQEQKDKVLEFTADPSAWGEKMGLL